MANPVRDLSSVYLKLDRANEHIETFRQNLKTFVERDPAPFGFRSEKTPGPDKAVEYALYAIVREPIPRPWALIVGDAIQNMRTALEYLAYELSTPKARAAGKTAFPITSDKDAFKNARKGIASIKGDERALIERVQPYAASKIPQNDPLAIMRKLSNLDKHQLLVPMIAAVSLRDSWVGSTNASIHFRFIRRGPVQHDTKIVGFTATPEDPALDMHVEPKSGLQVQLADTGIVGFDISALELLQMIEHHVRWAVIDLWFKYGHLPPTWAEIEQTS